jgi:predicted aconitase with swiveling domain
LSEAISAATLAPGRAEGAPLRLDEPLSFWGGLDSMTGRIIDRWHPQAGQWVKGRILMMPAGRGSSSGSAALAEVLRLGVGPAAILIMKRDAIVIIGALAAMELYGRSCPVALVAAQDWARLAAARWLDVHAEARGTTILATM